MIGIHSGLRQFRKIKYSWRNYDSDAIYKPYTKRQLLLRSYRFLKWAAMDGLIPAIIQWRFVWQHAGGACRDDLAEWIKAN